MVMFYQLVGQYGCGNGRVLNELKLVLFILVCILLISFSCISGDLDCCIRMLLFFRVLKQFLQKVLLNRFLFGLIGLVEFMIIMFMLLVGQLVMQVMLLLNSSLVWVLLLELYSFGKCLCVIMVICLLILYWVMFFMLVCLSILCRVLQLLLLMIIMCLGVVWVNSIGWLIILWQKKLFLLVSMMVLLMVIRLFQLVVWKILIFWNGDCILFSLLVMWQLMVELVCLKCLMYQLLLLVMGKQFCLEGWSWVGGWGCVVQMLYLDGLVCLGWNLLWVWVCMIMNLWVYRCYYVFFFIVNKVD